MPWFKVDDTLPFHNKVMAAGNPAMGLWLRAGAWSMQQLTDGHIPHEIARQLGTHTQAQRLCDAGLWIEKEDGYHFHDWTIYQRSRVQVKADQENTSRLRKASANFGNHIRWHTNRGEFDPDCKHCREELP